MRTEAAAAVTLVERGGCAACASSAAKPCDGTDSAWPGRSVVLELSKNEIEFLEMQPFDGG
jgi:hypothetical protein